MIVLGPASAYGQTIPQVTDALATIRAHDAALQGAFDNMRGMAMVGPEAEVLTSAGNVINLMREGNTTVIAVANLVHQMRDPDDLRRVRAQLQYSLDGSLQIADLSVQSMNGYLALLKGPATVAEVTKARDEMIAIREALRSLKEDTIPPASPH